VAGAWVVSVYTVKALWGAIAKELSMLTDVGTFGTVIHRSVAGLSTDVTADVISGAAAFISRV